MENLKVLTDNTALNPYVRRSYSMKVNTELLTANKSVVRAINEVAQNQKAILNSVMILYKKFNITLGDIVGDAELKEAYNALNFANIIDGLVRLNNRVENLSATEFDNDIKDIKTIINNDTESVIHILQTMHWDNIMDALVKINTKISDYIIQDTESEANEYTAIRDSISDLVSIVGSSDETNRNSLQTKYNNIIEAVLFIDSFVGADEASLRTLNDNGFVSASHAVLEFNTRLSNSLNDINTLKTAQAKNVNDFNNINTTITGLINDLQTLANNMGQATGSDLTDLGYTSIADGLAKLTNASNKLLEVVGDISVNVDYVNEYKEKGYRNIIDAIVTLQKAITTIAGSIDETSMDAIHNTGYSDIIDAIENIISLLGINEENISALEENNYSSVINAITSITEEIHNIREEIVQSSGTVAAHNEDLNAHPDAISGYFRHKTNHFYNEGEVVFIPELPSNLCLVCIKDGRTGPTRPLFEAL